MSDSLFNYLCSSLPSLDRQNLSSGSNTDNILYPPVEGLTPWSEFNWQTIDACFQPVLDAEFPIHWLTQVPPLQPCFHELRDETSVALIMQYYVQTSVCTALELARHVISTNARTPAVPTLTSFPVTWALGSASELPGRTQFRPDYAGVTSMVNQPYPKLSVLPGDTKQSRKWSTLHGISLHNRELMKPFEQALFYAIAVSSRYVFIVTDKELVPIRWHKSEDASASVAKSRGKRTASKAKASATVKHQRGISSASTESSGSAYSEHGSGDQEGCLEFTSVQYGSKLFRIAIWALHLFAATDRSVADKYHHLDDWYPASDGVYVQNGSGRIAEEGWQQVTGVDDKIYQTHLPTNKNTWYRQHRSIEDLSRLYYYDGHANSYIYELPTGLPADSKYPSPERFTILMKAQHSIDPLDARS